jgi:Flp pilus assembly protein TadG
MIPHAPRSRAQRPTRNRRSAATDWVCAFIGTDRGNTAVEFAFILPPLMLLLVGIMELGRGFWANAALTYAVEQAARCAAIDATSCGTASEVQSYAANQSGATFSTTVFTVSTAACGKLVSASYPLTLAIPFAPSSITLTAQSCYPK